MARKYVSKYFKSFFAFIFFFYLNKFNIIIDTYKRNCNLIYLFKIFKNSKKKRYTYRKQNKNAIKFRYDYIFRYKSKKIYKKRKLRKYGYMDDYFNRINKTKFGINFLFFYWKYFIMFLGLKIRDNSFYLKRKSMLHLKKNI